MAGSITHIDKQLAERMLRGEQRAFDEFFEAHFARLYRFCRARIGDDEDTLKDLVQRTLVRGIDKLESYRGEASLFTWLCRLCLNEISDHLRRAGRDAVRLTPLDGAGVRAVLEALDTSAGAAPEDAYRRAQLGQFVQAVLDHLPERQSSVLEWKYMQGLTVEEIAGRMNTSQEAIQSLLARARHAFRAGFDAVVRASLDELLGDAP